MTASVLALVLVVGLSVSAWAYLTGRLGIGPLSAKDEAAVTAIADGVEAPKWADAEQRKCAADELVHSSRSAELEKHGLVKADGDGWTYTGDWRIQEATTYVESLLDCSDDWAAEVGDDWDIEDDDCLDDIGTATMADYFIAETLTLSEGADQAEEGRGEAVDGLDECYVDDPPEPEAKARPAYRAVNFTFEDLDPESGDVTLQIQEDGAWTPLGGRKHTVTTPAGGRKGCVETKAEATYPWGSTSTTEKKFCGTSTPSRVYWLKNATCTYAAGCTKWDLHYEGFESFDTNTVQLVENGGDCMSASGECTSTFVTPANGRGVAISWSVYAGYDEAFEARIGSTTVVLPN